VPNCGDGSSDPENPQYCEVMLDKVCLDSGECGRDCGEGFYGGAASNSVCTACPAGTWSNRKRTTFQSSCVPCPTGTYSTAVGCCTWTPAQYPLTVLHPSATCTICPVGTYSNVEGSTACKKCPQSCVGGGLTGLYCAASTANFTDLDLQQLGGAQFFTTPNNCAARGGTCRQLTTALEGTTSAGQCELDWQEIPMPDGSARPQPYARFDNTLYTNELPDTPRSRLATGGDSYSLANTPTVFTFSDYPESQ